MSVNLEKFTSLLEIGFALHFAFPIIRSFWEGRFNDITKQITEIGTDTDSWRSIVRTKEDQEKLIEVMGDHYIKIKETEGVISFASVISILVAVYNAILLILIGYGRLNAIGFCTSLLLLFVALLPMPIFLLYVYFRVIKNINAANRKKWQFIFDQVQSRRPKQEENA
jgi:hypothetical protein